jgi:hypothetical protein
LNYLHTRNLFERMCFYLPDIDPEKVEDLPSYEMVPGASLKRRNSTHYHV